MTSQKPNFSEVSGLLNAQAGRCVMREHLAGANIFREHDRRLVTDQALKLTIELVADSEREGR